jgi:uncharacterized membrane protein
VSGRRSWSALAGLLALAAIPLTAGSLRLLQLAGGPDAMPADPRFTGLPLALVAHIVGAGAYVLLGILQLVPRLRLRHRAWHRRAGRVTVAAGLTVALSALWLTLFYAPQPGTGHVLYVLRLGFATALAACLVLGVTTARRRDFAAHRRWMLRAFAIGLGAGTQAFTEGLGEALFGDGVLVGDLAKGVAWIINLAVVEWAIRRPAARPSSLATPQPAGAAS